MGNIASNSSSNSEQLGPSSPGETSPLIDATPPGSGNGGSSATIGYGSSEQQNSTSAKETLSSSVRRLSIRVSDLIKQHTGTIGYLGSMSIAVNSLTGPAMLNLPATFSRSGIIPTLLALVFVCIVSALCCLHMANTISKVPNNHNFKQEVEYSEAFRHFWGERWFIFTEILFFCCITCLNISSIVDTAQVVDTFLGHWFPGGTCALEILVQSHSMQWVRWDYSGCSEEQLMTGECLPFRGNQGILLTAGNLVTTIFFLPLALMDLKENASWQIVGFVILLLTSIQFVIEFSFSGLNFDNTSWWGDTDDLLGVVLFNFALVIAIPAWLYEREPHVDVPTVITGGSVLSVVLYVLIGLLGSLAIRNVSENMLESMMSGMLGVRLQLGASIFAFAIIGLGIPLFSVLSRLNLTGSGLCTQNVGNVLAVYIPFALSWFLNNGEAITKLLSWGGMIFTSLVGFILPIVLAIHTVKQFDTEGSISVYFGFWTSKRSELNSLRVLLFLTIAAIAAAMVDQII